MTTIATAFSRPLRVVFFILALVFSSVLAPHISFALDITVTTAADYDTANPDPNFFNDGDCSLREAINNATDTLNGQPYPDCDAGDPSGADTIKFSGVSSITLLDGALTMNTDVKIQGPVTIDGNDKDRIFFVTGSNGVLRLDQVTLQHGHLRVGGAGGAVYVANGGSFYCKTSILKENKANNTGGAAYLTGKIQIDGCSFENNEAGDNGGAIDMGSFDLSTISASNFSGNKAGTNPDQNDINGGSGGAITLTGGSLVNPLFIQGCRFNGNTAMQGTDQNSPEDSGGGAIYNSGVMSVVGSLFAGNQTTGDKWHGGAIFNSSNGILLVGLSHFGTSPLPLLPPPFDSLTDPNKTNGANAMGGAIFNFGSTFILASSFIGNTSAFNGGALANATTSDANIQLDLPTLLGLLNGTFTFTDLLKALTDIEGMTVANSTISNNTAANQGGGIYHKNKFVPNDVLINLVNDTIANNTAAEGGGIYNGGDGNNDADPANPNINFDEILLNNTILSNNTATGQGMSATGNCGGGTASGVGTNNVIYPQSSDCADAHGIHTDPKLSGTAELTFSIPAALTWTLPLDAGSSALGNGDENKCESFPVLFLDQRFFPRPQGDPSCDVGSYESGNTAPTQTPTPSPTPTATETPTPTETPTASPTESPTPTETATPTPTPVCDGSDIVVNCGCDAVSGAYCQSHNNGQAMTSSADVRFYCDGNLVQTDSPKLLQGGGDFHFASQYNCFGTFSIEADQSPGCPGGTQSAQVVVSSCGPTPTPTETPTATASPTPSETPTASASPTPTSTDTSTPSPTPTAEVTASPTPTDSSSPTPTPTAQETASPTPTGTDSQTPTPTPTAQETASPTPSDSSSPTPTPTASDTASPTPTPSDSSTPTASPTPVVTPNDNPTPTPTVPVDCNGTPGGSAVFDQCGVCGGDGTSCLGCNSVDITSTLFTLDGSASGQKGIERRLSRLFVKAGGSKNSAKAFDVQADKFYLGAWSLAWSVPQVIVNCSNSNLCVTSDHSSTISAYSQNVHGLRDLSLKIGNSVLKKARSASIQTTAKSLIRQAKKLHDSAIATAATVPTTSTTCSS